MRRNGWIAGLGVILFVGVLLVANSLGGPKIYWHFTFKAFVHLPDSSAVEWAWVTMVEMDKAKAFPDEAATAREYHGELQGTVFAFIRGAAWRSSHRYKKETRCHDRPAEKSISWGESDSDSVFAAGQLDHVAGLRTLDGNLKPPPFDQFRFGFTNRKILHEDGSWEDLKSQTHVFVGAVNVEGRAGEETKGNFRFQEVNYRDDLVHHSRCEKNWVEQYLTVFRSVHFTGEILAVGANVWDQKRLTPNQPEYFVWQVHRSTSREHPHWKQQIID